MSCAVESSSFSDSPLHLLPPSSSASQLLIQNICRLFLEICAETEGLNPGDFTAFDALHTPSISLADFLIRILKFTYCSVEKLVLALIYIDRIANSHPLFVVNRRKIHRLFLSAIIVAIKFTDDRYYNNEYYAKVGGVSLKEMNRMEKEFLFLIGFKLFVSNEEFREYEEKAKKCKEDMGRKHCMRQEGQETGN